jgi:hypothetical protein
VVNNKTTKQPTFPGWLFYLQEIILNPTKKSFNLLASNFQSIKAVLGQKTGFYNTPSFIVGDPISVPHLFTKKEDIEISERFFWKLSTYQEPKNIFQIPQEMLPLKGST